MTEVIQFNGEPIWALRDRVSHLREDYDSKVTLHLPDGQLSKSMPVPLFFAVADILELFAEDLRRYIATEFDLRLAQGLPVIDIEKAT